MIRSNLHEYQLRADLLASAELGLKRAQARGDQQKIVNCQRQVMGARERLAKAKAAAATDPLGSVNGTGRSGPTPTAKATERKKAQRRRKMLAKQTGGPAPRPIGASTIHEGGSGIRFVDDPDSSSRTVWAFKTGTSFHRRDCHIVEAREGAVQIPIATARKRKLERCMHCAPMVR